MDYKVDGKFVEKVFDGPKPVENLPIFEGHLSKLTAATRMVGYRPKDSSSESSVPLKAGELINFEFPHRELLVLAEPASSWNKHPYDTFDASNGLDLTVNVDIYFGEYGKPLKGSGTLSTQTLKRPLGQLRPFIRDVLLHPLTRPEFTEAEKGSGDCWVFRDDSDHSDTPMIRMLAKDPATVAKLDMPRANDKTWMVFEMWFDGIFRYNESPITQILTDRAGITATRERPGRSISRATDIIKDACGNNHRDHHIDFYTIAASPSRFSIATAVHCKKTLGIKDVVYLHTCSFE